MEKEASIICLVYIDRLLKKGFIMENLSWKNITFTALVVYNNILLIGDGIKNMG